MDVEKDAHCFANLRVAKWEIRPNRMDLSYMQGVDVVRSEQNRLNIARASGK